MIYLPSGRLFMDVNKHDTGRLRTAAVVAFWFGLVSSRRIISNICYAWVMFLLACRHLSGSQKSTHTHKLDIGGIGPGTETPRSFFSLTGWSKPRTAVKAPNLTYNLCKQLVSGHSSLGPQPTASGSH